jgi:hypothetical protein
MSRCWTCGSEFGGGWLFTCPKCQIITRGFQDVREIADAAKTATDKLDELIYEQQKAFQDFSNELSGIASAIEWGFSELSWQIQQQTNVLREISHKMDIPSQIQATEWRRMAEELRVRGVYDKSLDFFLKALEANPLDYQIYIGLGRTYLCLSQFEDAEKCFLNSLPHAPQKENFDYKSYSYRLVARVKYCGMDTDSAISCAEQAVSLSPNYWKAYYDLAQYCAVKGDLSKSAYALRKAIEAEKLYFPMAENERDFAPVRNVLEDMRSKAKAIATRAIAEAVEALQKAEDANAQVYASTEYKNAKSKLYAAKDKMAVGTYEAFLEAKDIASEALDAANVAKNAATKEVKRRLEEEQRIKAALHAVLKQIHICFGLILLGSLSTTFAFFILFLHIEKGVETIETIFMCSLMGGWLLAGIGAVGYHLSGEKPFRGAMGVFVVPPASIISFPVALVLYPIALKKAKDEYKKDIERIRQGTE